MLEMPVTDTPTAVDLNVIHADGNETSVILSWETATEIDTWA